VSCLPENDLSVKQAKYNALLNFMLSYAMIVTRRRFCLALILLVLTLSASGAEQNSKSPAFDWKNFSRLEAAQKEIDLRKPDTNLLLAAVFHATNAQRAEHKLKPLRYDKKAGLAAAVQSEIMRQRGAISHENPGIAKYRTLEDRAKAVGLDFRLVAENLATAFGYAYESGRTFYVRKEKGKEIYSYKPGGEPIRPHTYISFAEALLDSWMKSPGHRKNILLKDAQYIGVSCLPAKKQETMVTFYCTQVFFSPMKE
jgi:uncharacterized protein YkwD